jgi:2-polyprenyl-3-methyl-5-hydroxy-6-metoxy-1,4-benzoquinol methylase
VLASQRYPHCAFISANILEWDAPASAFDAVISVEVIEHVDRDLQAKYLDIARRLLKPGGHLILTTPNADTMRAMPGGGKEWSHQPIENWLTPRELRTLLESGFTVRSVDSIIAGMGSRGSYRLMNSARIDSVMQAIGAGSAWERLRLRTMFGLHLVAHAQKL